MTQKPIPDDINTPETHLHIPLVNLSDDDRAWIERRATIPLCWQRIASDLQQLATEIQQLDKQHNDMIDKIKESIGLPKSMRIIQ